MSDPKLTKLRILKERAEREHEAAKQITLDLRRRMEAAQVLYFRECKAAGFCGACEKSLLECECVSVGA